MAVVELITGTKLVDATEWSLTTDSAGPDATTTEGEFDVVLDLSDMVAGDQLQLRFYEKARSGDTQRLAKEWILNGAQSELLWTFRTPHVVHGWDFTADVLAGTSATVLWSIRYVMPPSLTAFGILDMGTAAAIATATFTLRSGHGISNTSAVIIRLLSGTNAFGKSRVASYSGAGDVFNVDPAWNANGETTPSGTITYIVQDLPPNPTSTVPAVTITAAGITSLFAQLNSANVTAGSVGKTLGDFLTALSSDKVLLAPTTHTSAIIPTVSVVTSVTDLGTAAVDSIWDEQLDGTVTGRQSIRLINSASGAKASGMATTTAILRDLADTKDRVTATVDSDGNRSAVTRDLS